MTHCAVAKCLQSGKNEHVSDKSAALRCHDSASSVVDEIRALEKASIACGNAKSLFTDNINLYWQEQLEYNERPEVQKGGRGAMNEVAKNYKTTLDCWQRFDKYRGDDPNDYKGLWRQCLWELYKK